MSSLAPVRGTASIAGSIVDQAVNELAAVLHSHGLCLPTLRSDSLVVNGTALLVNLGTVPGATVTSPTEALDLSVVAR